MSRIYTANNITLPSNTERGASDLQNRLRVAGLVPSMGFTPPQGGGYSTQLATLNDPPEGGFWAMMRESNSFLAAGGDIHDFIEREAASLAGSFGGQNERFDPNKFVSQVDSRSGLAPGEKDFLLESSNQSELIARWRQISQERGRYEAIGAMGFWSSIGVGLLGAVTDPISYIPLFGQAAKVKSGLSVYRAVNASLKAGTGIRSIRMSMAVSSAKRGFWVAGAENVAIEAAFQSYMNFAAIDPEKREGQMLPSLAIAGAFGSFLGGGVGGVSGFVGAGRIRNRASNRIGPGGLDGLGGAGDGPRPTEPGGGGSGLRGPGARSRLRARAAADQASSKATGPIAKRAMDTGAAENLEDALEIAEGLVQNERILRASAKTNLLDGDVDKLVDDIMKDIAGNVNRPKKGVAPMRGSDALENPAISSVFNKMVQLAEDAGLSPDKAVGLAKSAAKAANGMGRFTDIRQLALGRGISSVLIDQGEVAIPLFDSSGSYRPKNVTIRSGKAGEGGLRSEEGEPWVASFTHPTKDGEAGFITVDLDAVHKMWDENIGKVPVSNKSVDAGFDEILESIVWKKPREIASNRDEFADQVVLHEIAHDELASQQRDFRKKFGDTTKVWSLIEAQSNRQALDWLENGMADGPAEDPSVGYGLSADGFGPAPRSVPIEKATNGRYAVRDWFWARGIKKKFAPVLEQWSYWTSANYRAATSSYVNFRTLMAHLTDDPFYRVGHGPSAGTAMSRRDMLVAGMSTIHRDAKRKWRDVSRGLEPDKKLDFDQLSERIQRAQANVNGDSVNDAYSSLVNEAADTFSKINDAIYERGKAVGFEADDMPLPDQERYYRRIYDFAKLRRNEQGFIDMLIRNGVSEDAAPKILQDILANKRDGAGLGEDIVKSRRSMEYRGDQVGMIPYEELAPFLENNIFKAQDNLAKSIGGEVELRIAAAEAAKEMGIKDPILEKPVVDRAATDANPDGEVIYKTDDNGNVRMRKVLNWDAIQGAIDDEIKSLASRKGIAIDPDEITKSWKQNWVDVSELREKFPEQYEMFKDWKHQVVDLGLSQKQILSEEKFARKYMNDSIRTLQNIRDIPNNPDSWFEARVPALVKNISHMVMGGGLAIANLADFHRSVSEYGLTHTFKNEWGLFMRDAGAWAKRNEMTDALGLAVEDIAAEIQRVNRNASQHELAETGFERLAERGASLMSKLNLMDRTVNGQQRAFSSGAQAFIMNNVGKMVTGEISAGDALRLERLGIGKAAAKKLDEAFTQHGVLDNAVGEYRWVEPWEGESFDIFKNAVRKAVYVAQTSPNRMELFDFQVQGMSSLLFIYRNWVNAANNRLIASGMSNPDMKLMSGALASIALGGFVTLIRAAIAGELSGVIDDPAQFARRSIDNGGYLGLMGEANNTLARITNGWTDMNPIGEGKMRYYDGTTALASVMGPVWTYPKFGIDSMNNIMDGSELDRSDIERMRSITPYVHLFYADGLWNMMAEEKGEEINPDPIEQ